MIKDIKNFPLYAIDDDGNVWSKKNNKWGERKIYVKLKLYLRKDGYYEVSLYKNNKRFHKKVHHLVLESFISDKPIGKECCHNDGNRINNKVQNLRWDTPSNNQKDRICHKTDVRGERHKCSKLNSFQVRIIKHLLTMNKISQYKIAILFNVSRSTILSIKLGNNWSWLNTENTKI